MAFTGEASEAVHYALHYLGPLVTMEPCEGGDGRNGMVGGNCRLLPCLDLPVVFDLLHHANQVSPLFALEAVVGVCMCVCVMAGAHGRAGRAMALPLFPGSLYHYFTPSALQGRIWGGGGGGHRGPVPPPPPPPPFCFFTARALLPLRCNSWPGLLSSQYRALPETERLGNETTI